MLSISCNPHHPIGTLAAFLFISKSRRFVNYAKYDSYFDSDAVKKFLQKFLLDGDYLMQNRSKFGIEVVKSLMKMMIDDI